MSQIPDSEYMEDPIMLTADTLRGVWVMVSTPWDANYEFDEEAFRHNVSYQCDSGVHGLYTGGSSGEFFALDLEEFCRCTNIFLEIVQQAGMPHQVGCTASDTRGALRRAEYAVEQGAGAIQIAFPYCIKLTVEEGIRFFEDVARACGPVPLVHYATGSAKLMFEAEDYQRLKDRVPTLIGTKLTKGDPLWFAGICEKNPQLIHFSGEYTFAADFAGGARGIYSWLGLTNPRLAVEWYEALVAGDMNRAMEIQVLVNRFKLCVKTTWPGKSDPAVNKVDAAINPNVRTHPRVRPPYRSSTMEDVERAREWARENFPDLVQL